MTSRFLALILFSVAIAPALLVAQSQADEMAGAVLFRDKGCAQCHGVAGVGTTKGPALAGIGEDKNWPPEKITQHILNGGQKMPPFADSLTDPEIAQIVAYLRAKNKPVPPPRATGN